MVNTTTEAGRADWKLALIEIVASKSGLWTEHIITEGGSIDRIRNRVTKDTRSFLEMFNLRGF